MTRKRWFERALVGLGGGRLSSVHVTYPQERRFYAVFAPMQKKIAAVDVETVRKLKF